MLFDSQWVTMVLVLGTIGMLVASAFAAAARSRPWFVACWSLFTVGYGSLVVEGVLPLGSGVSLVELGSVALAVGFYMMLLMSATAFGLGVSRYTTFWYVFVVSFVSFVVFFVAGVVALLLSALGMPG